MPFQPFSWRFNTKAAQPAVAPPGAIPEADACFGGVHAGTWPLWLLESRPYKHELDLPGSFRAQVLARDDY